MNDNLKKWRVGLTVFFGVLAVPIALSATVILIFSHMGMGEGVPWPVYLVAGAVILLPLLVTYLSFRSIVSPGRGLFLAIESVILLIVGVFVVSPAGLAGALGAFGYGVAGVAEYMIFRRSSPHVTAQRTARIIGLAVIAALIIAGVQLCYFVFLSIPKLPAEKRGIRFSRGTLQFHDDAKRELFLGRLAGDQEIQGMMFPKDTWVYFYATGEIEIVNLSRETPIRGIYCRPGTSIHFYKSGQMSISETSRRQEIDGKVYPEKTVLHFNEDGSIERSTPSEN